MSPAVKRKVNRSEGKKATKKAKVVTVQEPEKVIDAETESISDDGEDLMAAAQNLTFDDYEDDEEGDWEEQTDEDGEMKEAQEDDLGREAAGGELEGLKETAELYKSNIFKLEIDEMLKEISVNYDKHKRLLAALKDIKKTFEDIPTEKETLIVQYIKDMQKKGVTVPVTQEQPPSDALYKFTMQKPRSVNVVGSYALRTIAKTKKAFNVDVAVEMPSSLFQEKDHVDNRYFYKRSCYLAGLAHALKKSKKGYQMEFSSFNGDHHRPVLVIHAPGDKSDIDFSKTKCVIRIIPCIATDVFPSQRLAPSKCNLRKDNESDSKEPQATPIYNASILKDTVPVSSLAFLYQHAKSTPAFKEAVMLAKIWLYQRGLDASNSKGSGFGLFLFSMLMGYLLQSGVKGNRKLSTGYSSYQLMRGTMDFLANHDFAAEPVMIGTFDHPEFTPDVFRRHYDVVIVDPTGTVNLAAGMTLSGLAQVQYEAKLAMAFFNDSTDRFEALFLKKVDDGALRFDNFAKIKLSSSETIEYSSIDKFDNPSYQQTFARRLGSVLKKGLTDRAELIAIQYDSDKSWKIDASVPEDSDCDINVGLILNTDRSARLVDQGPDAQQKEAAEEFRKFWGSKAELRRFKDGSILESVVWQTQGYENRTLIVRNIVRYLLQHHFGLGDAQVHYWAGQFYPYAHLAKAVSNQLYNRKFDINGFQPVMTAFNELAKTIRATDSNLPLLINNVYPADPSLRYANAILPYSIDFDNIAAYPSTARYIPAIDVIVQLEGSSKWPDDLSAFQNVKLAFYLKIAQELENASIKSVVVDDVSETNPMAARGYLDVYYYGFVFRCHLHVAQEGKILQRIVDNKQSDKRKKEIARSALEKYEYRFQHRQLHTFHIQAVCAKHPAFSTTMRLVKRWFGAHLLTSQVSEEMIELLCAHVFVEPHPWSAPVSAFAGFIRVLALLASWDWRKSPLIVDIEGELTSADRDSILKNFTQLRERNPNITQGAMVIATAKDKSGLRWTQSHPNKAVAARIQVLAKAAVSVLEQAISSGNDSELKRMFVTSMADYHVVIQLKTSRCTRYYQSLRPQPEYLSLKKAAEFGDKAYAGFDPVSQFVSELEKSYGDLLMIFHNKYGGDKIGLVWNPALTGAKQWRVTFGCNSIPVDMTSEGVLKPADGKQVSKLAVPNFEAVLKEIERLGEGLIESITVQNSS